MLLLLYCDVVYPVPEALVTNIWSRLGLYTALVCDGFPGWGISVSNNISTCINFVIVQQS